MVCVGGVPSDTDDSPGTAVRAPSADRTTIRLTSMSPDRRTRTGHRPYARRDIRREGTMSASGHSWSPSSSWTTTRSSATASRGAWCSSGQIKVVGEAGTGREALAVITREHPDVALVDYQMPDHRRPGRGARASTRDGLPTRVLLLSAVTDSAVVFKALEEGASGLPVQGRPPGRDRRRRPARGEGRHGRSARARRRAGRADPDAGPAATPALSERERQVLKASPGACRSPSWPPSCSSGRARSRPTPSGCTRSSASPTAPPRSPPRCATAC